MSHGRSAGVVDLYGVEIAGITGCAQTLVLSRKLNHAQNVINNIGCGRHNANVLAGTVTNAPRYGLPASQTEQCPYRAMLRH